MQSKTGEEFGEGSQDRIHRLGVEPVRGADPPGHDGFGGKAIGEVADGLHGTGNHATSEFVDGGEVDVGGHMGGDIVGTCRHCNHGAGRCLMHEACPHRDDPDRSVQVEDSRQRGGHQFADAVSGKRRRSYAEGHGQLRQRVFHREQCRLGQVGGLQAVPVEHLGFEVDAQFFGEADGTAVEVLPEHSLGVVQAACHADMLSALTGKQERHLRRTGCYTHRVVTDRDVLMLGGGQHDTCIGAVGHHGRHPDLMLPPAGQGERDIGQ